MGKEDSRVWEWFLLGPHPHFVEIEYDVRLGGQTGTVTDYGSDAKEMWETLVKKRVDAIAETESEAWIIEVKPTASMAALGQVLCYEALLMAERPPSKPARKVIVAGRIDEDLVDVIPSFGVTVWIVSAASAAGLLQPFALPART